MGRGRVRDVALAVGLLSLAASVGVVLQVLRDKGLDTAADVGQVVGVALAAGVPAALLGLWWWRGRAAAAVTTGQVASAADVLARSVAEQWRREAVARQLDDPDPIPVRWRLTDRPLMDHGASVAADGRPVWEGSSDGIDVLADRFRALRRNRLVLLGGPGAGKTTLAVQLVRELLKSRKPEEPVPVLLSAASWDVEATPDVWEWTADQLRLGHPALAGREFGGEGARHLVADRMVVPVLDGLDEVPPQARTAMLAALNRHLGDAGGLILTCRTDEYTELVEAAGDVLTGAAVAEPDLLTPAAAAGYLRRCLPPVPSQAWRDCLDALERGTAPVLAEVCATPLGLWLIRVTQIRPGGDPAHLTDPAVHPGGAHLRAHLFDGLVAALIESRPPTGDAALFRPRRAHDPAAARRWLAYLAHHLTGTVAAPTRDLAWWRLAATVMPLDRFRRDVVCVLGLGGALAVGALVCVSQDPVRGAAVFLSSALFCVPLLWADAREWPGEEPGRSSLAPLRRTRSELRVVRRDLGAIVETSVLAGVVTGLWGAGAALFMGGNAPMVGAAAGLVGLVMAGAVAVVSNAAPMDGGRAAAPRDVWRADRALTGTVAFSMGAGVLTVAVLVTMASGTDLNVPLLAVTCCFPGAVMGVVFLKPHRAWPAYLVMSHELRRRRLAPRDLMGFLDDAHRLGLLRAVGPVYQFRHADFQDHLATRWAQGALRAGPGEHGPARGEVQ
ncbi:hypothetical protein [Actinocorallia herbida]|nr:hypothetical protein [Actinocorallia herbida]